jgi:tetratricopeptide (TPR) repeat protein
MRFCALIFATALAAAEQAPELTEATRAFHRGDMDAARSAATGYLKLHPASSEAQLLVARTEMVRGDLQAAYRELEQIVRREPRNADALYYFSKLCGILSHVEYQQLYELAPESGRVHQLLGESYQAQGNLPKAEEEFRKTLEANPRSVRVLVALGDVKRAQGDFDEAVSLYSRAIKIEPREYDAAYGLGVAYLFRQEPKTAIDWFRRSLALEPNSTAARLALGDAYMRVGKLEEAVTELKAVVALERGAAQAYVLLARAYQKLDRPREADEAFQKARVLLRSGGKPKP